MRNYVSINNEIREFNYQDDFNIVDKKRNNKELDKCCDTFKIYLGIIILLLTFVICISLVVLIIFDIINK